MTNPLTIKISRVQVMTKIYGVQVAAQISVLKVEAKKFSSQLNIWIKPNFVQKTLLRRLKVFWCHFNFRIENAW